MVIRYKSAPQSIAELLEMPNLKRASDIPEADMTEAPEVRNVKSKRPAAMEKTAAVASDKPKKPLSKKKALVGARVSEDLVNAFRAHSDKYADAVEDAMQDYAQRNGWL